MWDVLLVTFSEQICLYVPFIYFCEQRCHLFSQCHDDRHLLLHPFLLKTILRALITKQ
jgi:hypothetical protein